MTTRHHEGEVRLYDSKFNVLSDSLKEQIAVIYKEATQSNVITVRAIPVQQQTGGVDWIICQCFCLPCSCIGEYLGKVTFEQKSPRIHLVHCFEQNCLQPLSSSYGSIAVKWKKTKRFRIHLICNVGCQNHLMTM